MDEATGEEIRVTLISEWIERNFGPMGEWQRVYFKNLMAMTPEQLAAARNWVTRVPRSKMPQE